MKLLPCQLQQWKQLYDYKKQSRVPQALLINGTKGIGKLNLAEQFAFSLLCVHPSSNGLNCGNCKSCMLLKAESHPDLIKIYPEEPGKIITIGQIRHLLNQLNLKPQFNNYRVVIIHPAEQLNNSANNAFLKFLEEPTERTILILVSNDYSNIPATIITSNAFPLSHTTINTCPLCPSHMQSLLTVLVYSRSLNATNASLSTTHPAIVL